MANSCDETTIHHKQYLTISDCSINKVVWGKKITNTTSHFPSCCFSFLLLKTATMARKKVKLAFITNETSRKATLRKRKKSLMKKISELSTLCDIETCAILYSPFDHQPEVWPSPEGVQSVLAKFRERSELEQSKKMVNQEGFLKQRNIEMKDQIKKQRKDNREKELTQIMFQCLNASKILHNMTIIDMNDLVWVMEQNLKEIRKRMEELNKKSHKETGLGQVVAPAVANEAMRQGGENA